MIKLGKARTGRVVAALAVVALGSIPVARALQPGAAGAPAGCDANRGGLSFAAGGTDPQPAAVEPCITYTFPDYGESGIIVTSAFTLPNGLAAPSAVMHAGTYPPHPTFVDYGVARSINGGANWDNVRFSANALELAGNRCGSDPGFYQDPTTHRLFYYSDGGCEGPVSATQASALNLSYTDDNGETWVDNPGPPLQFFPVWDATVMFAGPPRTAADSAALAKAAYADVTYLCGQSKCFKSLDGGINFTEITDSAGNDPAGSNGALVAGADGTLYGGTFFGGASGGTISQQLNVSTDDGNTWGKAPGKFPSGFSPSCTRPAGSGSLSLDKAGDIYVGGIFNGQLAMIYSRDGGANWSTPAQMQMPGVGVDMCSFASDWYRPGHVAASYYGYTSSGTSSGTVTVTSNPHHGFISETDDLFDTTPVFTAVQVDSNADPLLPDGPPCGFPFTACVPHSLSRLDYISVTFSPIDGSPWAVFAKDECIAPSCLDKVDPSNPVGSVDQSRNYDWTNWMGAVATIKDNP